MTTDFLTQHHALTHTAGISSLPRTLLSVTGADRTQFLQSFTTNDIKKLAPGRGCEAFVTSTQGKTLGHVLIFCQPDQFILDTSPDQAAALISHFDRYIITEDVQFTDRSAEFSDLLLAGPHAVRILSAVAGDLSPLPLGEGAERSEAGEGLHFPPVELLSHVPATIAGLPVTIRRVEFASTLSYFIQTAASDAPAVASALSTAGAIPCEAAAVESARLEAGFPLFGLDITPENLPQEVARDKQAISFTKGCYLGQETVARIDAVGHVNRLLAGLKFESPEIPPPNTLLLADNQPIGHTTSAAFSPRLNSSLALAYLRRNHSKPGATLSSPLGPATVITLPLT